MTPKEKAEQLFTRFNKEGLQELVPLMDRFDRKKVIKQCALIAVDEIVNTFMKNIDSGDLTVKKYFEEIEKEIENI